MTSRSHSATNGPSYLCDYLTYGLGALTTIGLGGGQAYQIFTQGATIQGWTGVAGITLAFSLSAFAIFRSSQHQIAAKKPRDLERQPLLIETVEGTVSPNTIYQKLVEVFKELELDLGTSEQSPPSQNQEQQITAQIDKIKSLSLAKIGGLQKKIIDSESAQKTSQTKIERLERDLKTNTDDLQAAKNEIKILQAIMEDKDTAASNLESYIDDLDGQIRALLSQGNFDQNRIQAITTLLSSIKTSAANSRVSSAANTPQVTPQSTPVKEASSEPKRAVKSDTSKNLNFKDAPT